MPKVRDAIRLVARNGWRLVRGEAIASIGTPTSREP